MIIKGLSAEFRTFSTVVTQRESPMNFIDFKTALRNFEETGKCQQPHTEGAAQDSMMRANQKEPRSRDNNLCYACGRPGHRSYECKNKGYKRKRWCDNCKSHTHDTKYCRKGDSTKFVNNDGGSEKHGENQLHSYAFKASVDGDVCKLSGDNSYSLLVDCGATSHIITDKSRFVEFDRSFDPESHCIELADPQKSDVKTEEDSQCLMEAKDRVQTTLVAVKVNDSILEIKRWSTLTKAIRVMAWNSRFILNLKAPKRERKFGELTLSEMSTAKLLLFRIVQEQEYSEEISLKQGRHVSSSSKSSIVRLGPFLGDDGLLRVKGRLQFSDLAYEEKHPIIMPKSHMSLLLVQFQHTLLKHAGVNTMIASLRGQFWIIGVRRLAKQVKKECISCQIKDRMYRLLEKYGPPLPELRVKQAPPFTVTGMDHLGPLYCCDAPRRTFYILLFTCAVIRAVHLKLVNSLSCEDTVLALHRFAARRGLPSVIYSDNAKAFTAAQSRMLNQFGYTCPQWRCIAPRSPWWGGWWERLVRSVKVALKKSVGRGVLTRAELETSVHEIEACVNSRPLTFLGDELDFGTPLTPSHFLIGRCAGFQPTGPTGLPVVKAQDLMDRKEISDRLLDHFWDVWRSFGREKARCVLCHNFQLCQTTMSPQTGAGIRGC